MHGLHLTADLWGCRCADAWLLDAERLGPRCVRAVREAGLHAVAQLFHTFSGTPPLGGGITATVLLAESHVCVHTWPEQRAVTLDVYVCNVSADHSAAAQGLLDALIALFEPSQTQIQRLQRGQPPTARA